MISDNSLMSLRHVRSHEPGVAPDDAVADVLILAEIDLEREALDAADVEIERLRRLVAARVGVLEQRLTVAEHAHGRASHQSAGLLEAELGLELLERAGEFIFEHAA